MKQFNVWVLDVTVAILDFLYRGRDYQRFWVLEEIARAPYFAFLSVLHFRESMGLRGCLLYTSPSPRDYAASRMPSSA